MRLSTVLSLLCVACAYGRDAYPVKVIPCPRLAPAPTIDGGLADPCWTKAPLVSGFTRYNKPVLMDVQTAFRVGHDEQHLYLAIRCDEPDIAKVTPSHAGRDSSGVFRGEAIELFVDPHHDHTRYFQIAANLAGSLYDSRGHDPSWDSGTRLAARKIAKGWALELAIPWKALGVQPRPDTVVGLNVCRDRHAGGHREWSNWSQTLANFHDAPRFGHIVLSPTRDAMTRLAPELRKGGRTGPILVYGTGGYTGQVYLALARKRLAALEARLRDIQAEGDKELELGASVEVAKCLEVARATLQPMTERVRKVRSLDAAAWTRLSVDLGKLEARLDSLLWEARLAMLLKSI